MAYVITSNCERAGLCVDVCPTDSIHFVEDDPNWPTYYINAETCIDCGACEAECPNEAIFPDDELPDEFEGAAQKNADYFADGPGADQV